MLFINTILKLLAPHLHPGLLHPSTTSWCPACLLPPQVLFINTILKLLWPHLSPAIHKMAMEQAKAPLEDVCKKVRFELPAWF